MRNVGDRLAVGDPVRDVVELRRVHAPTVPSELRVTSRYFRRSTARWSCCFVIRERPSIPIRFASLYSCSFVRPFGRFVPERSPPRRPEEMSVRERRDDVFASPFRARSLLTVRAAISFALLLRRAALLEALLDVLVLPLSFVGPGLLGMPG